MVASASGIVWGESDKPFTGQTGSQCSINFKGSPFLCNQLLRQTVMTMLTDDNRTLFSWPEISRQSQDPPSINIGPYVQDYFVANPSWFVVNLSCPGGRRQRRLW